MEQQKRRIRCMGRGLMSLLLALALCLGLCVPALAEENEEKLVNEVNPEMKKRVSVIRDGFYDEFEPESPFLSPEFTFKARPGSVVTDRIICSYFGYEDEWTIKNISEDYVLAMMLVLHHLKQNATTVYDEVGTYYLSQNGWQRSEEADETKPVRYFFPGRGTKISAIRTFDGLYLKHWTKLDEETRKNTDMGDYIIALIPYMHPFTVDDTNPDTVRLDLQTTILTPLYFQLNGKRADEVMSRRVTDVAQDSYCYNAVLWALRKNVTQGTTDTTFSPNDTCTRAQILTFIWRYSKEPEPTIANPYTDVTEDAYYYKAALWAYEKGMVTGTEFNGSTPCTRASTMEYLWKLRGSPKTDGAASFEDVPAGADYAEAVAWAVKEKITNGVTDTTFAPERTCTRGNIVTFLERYSTREVIWDTLRQMDELIGKGTSEQAPPTDENPENAPPDGIPEGAPPDGIPEGAPTDESPENMPPES